MKTLCNLFILLLALTLRPAAYGAKKPPVPGPSLPAPSNLSASLITADQVRLTWQDNSSDERQFQILRSTDGFVTAAVFTTGANVTSYTDTGLLPGKIFAYRVRAGSRSTFSDYSNEATVTTPEPLPAPAAPSGLEAVTLDPARILLRWSDNSLDELEFRLERSTDGFGSFGEIRLPANCTEYTDTGLQSGTAYAYRIRACGAASCSDYSNTASANTGLVIGPWTAVFQGVQHATGLTAVANSPRQVVNALRIDLLAPGIRLNSSPRSANYAPEIEETKGMTVSHYLIKNELQVVINGNWFSPCCTALDGNPTELLGLAISTNIVVSSQESGEKAAALVIDANKNATLIPTNWPAADMATIDTAVAGKNAVLFNGQYVGTNVLVDPRTAVGLSQDRRYLVLVTIDGRQPGYSDGATDADTAAWMARFGASDAFNLDGGGSTTMAVADGLGGALVLNRPSGGIERAVGNHLGVYALPLASGAAELLGRTPQPQLASEEELLLQAIADSLVDPTPRVTVTPLAGGEQRIQVEGTPDYTYAVESAESLSDPKWQKVGRGRANELGMFEVIDTVRGLPRYYRAVHR